MPHRRRTAAFPSVLWSFLIFDADVLPGLRIFFRPSQKSASFRKYPGRSGWDDLSPLRGLRGAARPPRSGSRRHGSPSGGGPALPPPKPAGRARRRGLDAGSIRTLNGFSSLSVSPDRTLLFDLPVETGLARAEKRTAGIRPEAAEDRFEQEDRAFHGRIREGYLTLAAGAPERFRVIDGAADVETVHREVCRHLAALV